MFSDPQAIVNQLPISPGSSIADLGAGTGAFSVVLAKKTGPTGKVYACEVQKDMLTRILSEAHDHGLGNIQAVHSNIETHQGTQLRDGSIDWVIAANVVFQIEHRDAFAKEVARILKPNGSFLLVDWKESFGNLGPHVKDVIGPDEALKLFESVGLKKTPQVIESGAHHYGIVFKK